MRGSPSPEPVDCPAAPPSQQSTYARTLHSACLIVGGVPRLAGHLGVPAALLHGWLAGEAEPPQPIFLAAVEIILLHLDTRGPAT